MDLLPKSKSEFSDKEYWNKFFQKRGKEAFEWYGDYTQLCSILHKYIKQSDHILNIGCGNSRLCIDLYDVGQYHNNINVDISELTIKSMNQMHTENRPGLQFVHMDMLKMSFDDSSFNVVLDKGTLDALMSDSSEKTDKNADLMFSEIERVLKIGSRYICISLLQEHILNKIISWFPARGWLLRIHRCHEAEQQVGSNNLVFPVFVVVATKMKALPGLAPVMELCLDHDGNIQRVKEKDEIINGLTALQHYAIVRHKLSANTVLENQIGVELHSENNPVPRYVLYIIDRPAKTAKIKFAIFIVPQGRECEWLFGNENGQRSLAEKASCQRLVLVHLSRDHQYDGLDSIKSELSSKVVELSPAKLPSNYQIPFLTVGDNIGDRHVCHRGESPSTGKYVIEEVAADAGKYFRRLIFMCSQNIIQSEARLKLVTRKGKKNKKIEKKVVDLNYLACNHHKLMIAGLSFLPQSKQDEMKVMLVGLGGGSLAMFLHDNFPKLHLDVVEIDRDIAEIAKTWFGFCEDPRNVLHIDDGLNFIRAENRNSYDVIMLDVDSKDITGGLSCPPQEFLSPDILQHAISLLHDKGVMVINLACREGALKEKTLNDMQQVFGSTFIKKIDDEVNDVVYCLKERVTNGADVLETFGASLSRVNSRMKKCLNDDLFDVENLMRTMKMR